MSALTYGLALAIGLTGLSTATAASSSVAAPQSPCAVASKPLSRLYADAGLSGHGSDRVPADVKVDSGYRFVALGPIPVRLWPDKDAPIVWVMPDDTRAKAACKVVSPDGMSWLAVRQSDGTLHYIPATGAMPERQYDTEMKRLRKEWNTWILR